MFRSLPPRRSRAALRGAAQGTGRRVVLIALGANLVVAAAKLAAGVLSGSVAMLAEAGRSLPAERLQQLYATLTASPAIDEVLTLQAVYTGPEEVIVAAKVHPIANLAVDQLARAMDEIDVTLRSTFPEVADVFLDVTTYRLDTLPLGEGLTSVGGDRLADATALGPAATSSPSNSGQ